MSFGYIHWETTSYIRQVFSSDDFLFLSLVEVDCVVSLRISFTPWNKKEFQIHLLNQNGLFIMSNTPVCSPYTHASLKLILTTLNGGMAKEEKCWLPCSSTLVGPWHNGTSQSQSHGLQNRFKIILETWSAHPIFI